MSFLPSVWASFNVERQSSQPKRDHSDIKQSETDSTCRSFGRVSRQQCTTYRSLSTYPLKIWGTTASGLYSERDALRWEQVWSFGWWTCVREATDLKDLSCPISLVYSWWEINARPDRLFLSARWKCFDNTTRRSRSSYPVKLPPGVIRGRYDRHRLSCAKALQGSFVRTAVEHAVHNMVLYPHVVDAVSTRVIVSPSYSSCSNDLQKKGREKLFQTDQDVK